MSEENEPISAKDESKDIWVKFWLICFWVGVAYIILSLIGPKPFLRPFVCPDGQWVVHSKVPASVLGRDSVAKLYDKNSDEGVYNCTPSTGWGYCSDWLSDGQIITLFDVRPIFFQTDQERYEIRYAPASQVLASKTAYRDKAPLYFRLVFGNVANGDPICSTNEKIAQARLLDLIIDKEK